ncbi:MAG: hypothetical protein ACOCPM_07615 [Bacteroidales bacterium]
MWIRALLYWWPVPVFHFINIVVREYLLEPKLGGSTANILAIGALVLFVLIYTWLVIIKLYPRNALHALKYGSWWLLFTVVAHLLVSVILKGWSLQYFLNSFHLHNLTFWPVVYLCMLLAPVIMFQLRIKEIKI